MLSTEMKELYLKMHKDVMEHYDKKTKLKNLKNQLSAEITMKDLTNKKIQDKMLNELMKKEDLFKSDEYQIILNAHKLISSLEINIVYLEGDIKQNQDMINNHYLFMAWVHTLIDEEPKITFETYDGLKIKTIRTNNNVDSVFDESHTLIILAGSHIPDKYIQKYKDIVKAQDFDSFLYISSINDDLDKDNDLNENIHFEPYFDNLRDELLLLVDNADQLSITEVNTGLPMSKLNIERFFNHYDEHNEELDGFIRFNELFEDNSPQCFGKGEDFDE